MNIFFYYYFLCGLKRVSFSGDDFLFYSNVIFHGLFYCKEVFIRKSV